MDGCNGLGETWLMDRELQSILGTAVGIGRVRLVGRQAGRYKIYYFLGYIIFFSVDLFYVLKST